MKSATLSLILFTGIGLFSSTSSAVDSDSAFFAPEMGLLRQRDFLQYLRYDFVLGDQRTITTLEGGKIIEYSGLFLVQHERLQKLEELIDHSLSSLSSSKDAKDAKDAKFSELIRKQTEQVLKLDQAVIDWTYEYRFKIASDPKRVADYYDQALSHLPAGAPKNYEQVIEGLAAEIDTKLFQIRYPIIRSFLTPKELEELLPPIQDPHTSAFVSPKKRTDLFPLTRAQLVLRLHSAKKPPSPLFEKLCLEIFDASVNSPWSPDWEKSWSETRNLSAPAVGIFWAEYKYSKDWPALTIGKSSLLTNGAYSTETERVQREIDSFVDQKFDEDERFHFHSTIEQIHHEHWASLGVKHFAYFRLNEDQRNLLCARVFPDLNLKLSRALLELRLLELSEEERLYLAQEIYSTGDEFMKYLETYSKIIPEKEEQIFGFHEMLIFDYFESRKEAPQNANDATEHTLLNGQKVLDVELAREKKRRLLLEEYKKPSVANLISDGWKIEFAPYDYFWQDEMARFKDEWKRRELLHEFRKKTEPLIVKFNQAKTEAEQQQIASEISAQATSLTSDGHSPAVFAASFLSGATPRSLKDAVSVVKVAGVGFVCYLVSRYVGGRMALTILGFVGLREIYKISEELMHASLAEEKLDATEALGGLAQQFISFGVGSSFAHMTVDFSRISRMRKMDSYRVKIEKLNRLIEENQKEIERLSSVVRDLMNRLELEERGFGKTSSTFKQLSIEIEKTQTQMAQLQNGSVVGYQSSLEFYAKRLVLEASRLASNTATLLLIPLRKTEAEKQIPKTTLFQRFKRSESLGIAQYERAISGLERLQETEGTRALRFEGRPRSFLSRVAFNRALSNFKSSQQKISSALSDAEVALESSKTRWKANSESAMNADADAELVKTLNRKTIDDLEFSTKRLQKAVREFGKHTKEAKDLTTIVDGSLNDLRRLAKLQEARPQLGMSQQFLMRTEEFRQLFTMSSERIQKFEWEKQGDIYTKRFFAETFVRLQIQLSHMEAFRNQIARELAAGGLPRNLLLSEKVMEINFEILANRKVIEELYPLFKSYF